MAGKQKWGTKQDWLTGQAWCTLVFKGLSRVNPYVVFNPFPGCQGSSLTLQHGSTVGCRKDKGGVCSGGYLPTSPPVLPPAAAGKGQLKQLNPWDLSGLEM